MRNKIEEYQLSIYGGLQALSLPDDSVVVGVNSCSSNDGVIKLLVVSDYTTHSFSEREFMPFTSSKTTSFGGVSNIGEFDAENYFYVGSCDIPKTPAYSTSHTNNPDGSVTIHPVPDFGHMVPDTTCHVFEVSDG